jgi:hypothetical protein
MPQPKHSTSKRNLDGHISTPVLSKKVDGIANKTKGKISNANNQDRLNHLYLVAGLKKESNAIKKYRIKKEPC